MVSVPLTFQTQIPSASSGQAPRLVAASGVNRARDDISGGGADAVLAPTSQNRDPWQAQAGCGVPALPLTAPELVGPLELFAEGRGLEVFAQVRQPLFERKQRGGDGLGVGVGHVAPHGVGA